MKQNSPKLRSIRGPDARAVAMKLLAEGLTVSAVAREVGVDRTSVRTWRDSIEGQRELDDARKARSAAFDDAAEQSRRILREAAPLAAQRLRDRLASTVPFEAVTAAEAILARVGVPRASKVENVGGNGLDLSRLTDKELEQLEALHAKASGA